MNLASIIIYMHFSYCSIAFRNQKITLREIFYLLANAGYQGVELWANHVNSGVNLDLIKRDLKEHDLRVPMVSPYFNFTGTREKWEESIITATKFIEIAAFLEAPLIRAFTGTVGSKEATKKQIDDCAKGIEHICLMAKKKGITIALETHPSTLVDNVESTLNLIEKVSVDNLKVNLDIYHMFEVHKDPLMVLEALADHVVHVHAKNAEIKPEERDEAKHPLLHDPTPKANFIGVRPLAVGEMDYDSFISELVKTGFSGFVSVEWFGQNPEASVLHEIEYLDKVLEKHQLQDKVVV